MIEHSANMPAPELLKAAMEVVRLHDEVVNCTRAGGVDADEYDAAFEALRTATIHAPERPEA